MSDMNDPNVPLPLSGGPSARFRRVCTVAALALLGLAVALHFVAPASTLLGLGLGLLVGINLAVGLDW
jgi:hypothetical protein